MAEKVTDVVSGKIETTVTEQTTSEKEKSVSQTEQMKMKPLITTEDPSALYCDALNEHNITALSFKTTSIILVILRKTIIFAHSDAGSTASGVSFYRS